MTARVFAREERAREERAREERARESSRFMRETIDSCLGSW